MLFNLEEGYVFYASYHRDPVNKAIHFLRIWPIFFTALAIIALLSEPFEPPAAIRESLLALGVPAEAIAVHSGLAVLALYMTAYAIMDQVAGTLAGLLAALCYAGANMYAAKAEPVAGFTPLQVAVTVHMLCWVAQFYGHAVHEGRRPALLESWTQAFLTAPLFVFLEAMQALGYRQAFFERAHAKADANRAAFQAKKAS